MYTTSTGYMFGFIGLEYLFSALFRSMNQTILKSNVFIGFSRRQSQDCVYVHKMKMKVASFADAQTLEARTQVSSVHCLKASLSTTGSHMHGGREHIIFELLHCYAPQNNTSHPCPHPVLQIHYHRQAASDFICNQHSLLKQIGLLLGRLFLHPNQPSHLRLHVGACGLD